MKKFLIVLIIILILLLIVQFAFINTNKTETNQVENATINQNIQNSNNSIISTNLTQQNTVINESSNTITPMGMRSILQKYSNNENISTIQEEFYNFINNDVSEIYNLTNRKSNNAILQLYDTNRTEINQMNIYSGDDLLNIVSQIFLVGVSNDINYFSSYVDNDSLNENEDGYITFNVTFVYSNRKTIQIKACVANNNEVTPKIKFEALT